MGPHNSDVKEYLFVEICLTTSVYLLNHKRNIESWHLVRDIFGQVIFYYPPQRCLLIKSWEQIFLKAGNRSFSPILVFLEDTEFSRGNILEYKSSVQQTLNYTLLLVPMDYVGEGNATTMLDTHISTRKVHTHIFPNARVRVFDSLWWLFWNNRDVIYLLQRIQLY